MEKRFKNTSGDILVRKSSERGCGTVEMLHLFQENKVGYVIGSWNVRKVDGEDFPEFTVVGKRFMEVSYSFDPLEALKFGQKLAELLIELDTR